MVRMNDRLNMRPPATTIRAYIGSQPRSPSVSDRRWGDCSGPQVEDVNLGLESSPPGEGVELGVQVGQPEVGTINLTARSEHTASDPRRSEIAVSLLTSKWTVPILLELVAEPRRRQYLFARLRVSSSRLDRTVQTLSRWGLIERTWIPSGSTDSPGLAITAVGRKFLEAVSNLSDWQRTHHSELLTNDADWRAAHHDGQT